MLPSKVLLAPVLARTAVDAAIQGNDRDNNAADLISGRAISEKVKAAPPMYAKLAKKNHTWQVRHFTASHGSQETQKGDEAWPSGHSG